MSGGWTALLFSVPHKLPRCMSCTRFKALLILCRLAETLASVEYPTFARQFNNVQPRSSPEIDPFPVVFFSAIVPAITLGLVLLFADIFTPLLSGIFQGQIFYRSSL